MPKSIYYDENGNEQILSSSPSALSGLEDTNITMPTNGQILAYNNDGKVVNSDILDDKQDYLSTNTYNMYGVWSDTYYGTPRMFVPFPFATKYTITLTKVRYRSADMAMTDMTGSISVTNDLGFMVNGGNSAGAGHYGDITFTATKT